MRDPFLQRWPDRIARVDQFCGASSVRGAAGGIAGPGTGVAVKGRPPGRAIVQVVTPRSSVQPGKTGTVTCRRGGNQRPSPARRRRSADTLRRTPVTYATDLDDSVDVRGRVPAPEESHLAGSSLGDGSSPSTVRSLLRASGVTTANVNFRTQQVRNTVFSFGIRYVSSNIIDIIWI